MKKKHAWHFATAAFLLAAVETGAQPNNYYRFGGNYDHGTGLGVVRNLAGNGYVMTGTARIPVPNNAPAVFIASYDNAGNPVGFSNIYPITGGPVGPSIQAAGTAITSAPAVNQYAITAFTDFTTPAQSVLIRINAGGGIIPPTTPLGNFRFTSVVYDAANNWYAALGQSPMNNNDLELVRVNAATGAVMGSNIYDSGPGFKDLPSRLMIDPATGNYVLVGTSDNGVDQNVFVVRTAPNGALICSETFGVAGVNESGVDVTFGINPFTGAANDIVLGNISPSNTPFVIELNPFACPSYVSSTVLNLSKPDNLPTGITTDPSSRNYVICGKQTDVNTNGFCAIIDYKFNPINYVRYGQPWLAGDEDLTDVLFDASTARLVFCGEHQRLTPVNEFFPWLPMANLNGLDACPDPQGLSTSPIGLAVTNYTFSAPWYVATGMTVSQFSIPQTPINQCTVPFRLHAEESAPTVSFYPNPASTQLSISNLGGTDLVLELTNTLGEVVLRRELPAEENPVVDISGVAAGVYLCRITSGTSEVANEKLIIAR